MMKKTEIKSKVLNVRLTPEEYYILQTIRMRYDKNISELIRELINNKGLEYRNK